MTISKVLSEAVFRLDLGSGDLAGAIEELADALSGAGGVTDFPALLSELGARGRRASMVGEGEAAIVHAFSPAVDRPCLALGRSPAGIAVDSPAGPLVHFVCILLVPPGKRRAGFRLLNGLVVLLREPMVRTQLLLAETPEEALAICRETEGSRWATTAVWLKERLAAALRPSAAAGNVSGDKA
ncbi:MAG: PTS sugar transporter subunit IIA [bacterium]|nr:PTS sugar transporter subunit IIA [bacterium]